MKPKLFTGIFAALTTPFRNEEVSLSDFSDNLDWYNQTSLAGYVVLGSTGEAVFLSEKEAEAIISAARKKMAPGKKLIAGASRESVKEAINFVKRLADCGAEAVLVKPPYYYKSRMTGEALKAFYLGLADKTPLPLIIYHIPQNTGIPLEPELIIALASHPAVVGIKDSSGNLSTVAEVVPHVKPDFCFLTGAGNILMPSLAMGACGAVLALAAVAPVICCQIYHLFLEKRFSEAAELQLKVVPLNKLLTQTKGIPAIKYALDLLGRFGGNPRLPLLPLEDEGKRQTASLLRDLGLIS